MLKILLVVLLFAALVYLVIRVVQRRRSVSPPDQGPRGRSSEGPIGPDDDPDFLRGL